MRNFTVGRIWGIPIRLNVSLLVFIPLLVWLLGSGTQIGLYANWIEGLTGVGFDVDVLTAGQTPWVIGVLAVVGLFASVTLHELGHSWAAMRYGLEIESITLWILGGMAAFKSIPKEWDREFWIAVAGPITSLLVAGVCYLGIQVLPESSQVIRYVLGWVTITNVVLAVFNMLPAFPMDGGRVLRALLARRRPYASATRIAARVGVLFAFLFAIVGVLSFSPILFLLALFVYGAATTESRTVVVGELLSGLTVGDVATRDPHTVSADATVDEFVEQMIRERQTLYPVTDGGTVVGVVSLADLRRVKGDARATTTVESVMQEVPRLPSTADAFEALAQLNQSGGSSALVEEDGRVVGVLSESDYSHALTMRRGFQGAVGGGVT